MKTLPSHGSSKPLFLLIVALVAVAGGVAYALRQSYDIAATVPHTQVVHSVLERVMHRSVEMRSRDIAVPALDAPGMLQRGAVCYRDACAQCHGAPGVAPGPVGLGLQPLPGPLVDAARRWEPRHLYWITRYGIKMTGMPAWEYRLADEDLWAVVAFVGRLGEMTPAEYARRAAVLPRVDCFATTRCEGEQCPVGGPGREGTGIVDWKLQARTAFGQYACNSCHVIPGVVGPDAHVGPPLTGFGARSHIAGRLANTPDNLVRWLRDPQQLDPHTAMPDLDVSTEHARLMARYLAEQR
ncbi:c-type cytochrome [Uliginosibacterium sp. H1]|uniref:c-type cytochrome n=1 Tax=Uliginosibacterium sp. H1 TaxID=3114757 RepID=UPI002E1717A3|nr:c-type cytochrome [Uliginosibacterium sp. H1]